MRKKTLTLENWRAFVGINPTTHAPLDKLTGITSLSTNCLLCDNCKRLHSIGIKQKKEKERLKKLIKNQEERIKRQKKKAKPNIDIINDATDKRNELIHEINKIKVLVCGYCFADNTLKRRTNMQNPLSVNTEILTSRILCDDEIPFINRLVFRYESFGDLNNVTHAINFINIARENPHCTFAWWTKKPVLIRKAMNELGIDRLPENIVCIFSSYYVNEINTKIAEYFDFINIVFTVFDGYYLEEHPDVEITCGNRQCLGCMLCYTKHDDVVYVNELVK